MAPKILSENQEIYHLQHAIMYTAYAEVLSSAVRIVSVNEHDSATMNSKVLQEKALNDMYEYSCMYLSMQYALFRTSKGATAVDQGVTEEDLKNLFGPEYEELESHVESIEWHFEKLTKGLKVKMEFLHKLFGGWFRKEFRGVINDMNQG